MPRAGRGRVVPGCRPRRRRRWCPAEHVGSRASGPVVRGLPGGCCGGPGTGPGPAPTTHPGAWAPGRSPSGTVIEDAEGRESPEARRQLNVACGNIRAHRGSHQTPRGHCSATRPSTRYDTPGTRRGSRPRLAPSGEVDPAAGNRRCVCDRAGHSRGIRPTPPRRVRGRKPNSLTEEACCTPRRSSVDRDPSARQRSGQRCGHPSRGWCDGRRQVGAPTSILTGGPTRNGPAPARPARHRKPPRSLCPYLPAPPSRPPQGSAGRPLGAICCSEQLSRPLPPIRSKPWGEAVSRTGQSAPGTTRQARTTPPAGL